MCKSYLPSVPEHFCLLNVDCLTGKEPVTHWMDIDRLEAEYEQIKVVGGAKFID